MTGQWRGSTAEGLILRGRPDDHQVDMAAEAVAARAAQFIPVVREDRSARIAVFQDLIKGMVAEPGTVPMLTVFAYQPADALNGLADQLERAGKCWSTMVEIYEAWVDLAHAGALPGVSSLGQRTALAYLMRTRWHLYAAAFTTPDPEWLPYRDWHRRGDAQQVAAAARQARDEWLDVLDRLEDYPSLARDIGDPLIEVQLVLETRLSTRLLAPARPASGASQSERAARPSPADIEAYRHCVRAHLLPRFDVYGAWRVVWRLSSGPARAGTVAAGSMFALALVAVVAAMAGWLPYGGWVGAGLAVAGYAAVVVAALADDRSASWPWLLRQPASAGVGLLLLIAMAGSWWQSTAHHGVWPATVAAATLLLIGTGYLTVEAVNHRVRRPAGRVAVVAGFGLAHAALVTAIGLAVLLPAFADRGGELAGCWAHARCTPAALPPWLVFTLATAWAYASGVFTQILWDDQPFTAPLAHQRWRTGR